MSTDSLLTIELGTRCNNRCAFCPQHHLRCIATGSRGTSFGLAGQARELSTGAVIRRMEDGRKQGFCRIAFTGGEPTVRLDLVRLVRTATGLGYAEIGITTNGRMFAAGELARELVEAGLNRVSFSLHGPEAVHDSLSGVAGAFRQLLAGVAAVRECAGSSGRPLELHSVTLLLPQNVDLVGDIVRLAAGLGARIHIFQPFIASRPNLHVAAGYYVAMSRLVAAVAAAGRVATSLSTRVKPYNIPYCELPDLSGLEIQHYRLSTFRRQEEELGDLGAYGQRQFYRIDRCPTCPTPCPGYRIEHYPSGRMADEIVQDVTGWRSREIVLAGLDLLGGLDLVRCLCGAAAAGHSIIPVSGGRMWCEPERYVEAMVRAGVHEVVHVLRTEWDGTGPDGNQVGEPEPGNEEAVLHLARLLEDVGVESRLLVGSPDLPGFPYPLDYPLPFRELVIVVPMLWRGIPGQGIGGLLDSVGPAALRAAETLSHRFPVSVATFDALRVLHVSGGRWQKTFASRFRSDDWSTRMACHRFSTREYSFLFWSSLFWLY